MRFKLTPKAKMGLRIGYTEAIHNAYNFYRTIGDFRQVAFRRPPFYQKSDAFILLINLILVQWVLLSMVVLNYSPWMLLNTINIWFNVSLSLGTANRRMLKDVYWVQYAGEYVVSHMISRDSSGRIAAMPFTEHMEWLRENVAEGEWSVYDPKHWFRDLDHAFAILQQDDLMEIQFVFKKRRDAMMFKLVFGGT